MRDPNQTYTHQGELYGPEYEKDGRGVKALDKIAPLKGKRLEAAKARMAAEGAEPLKTGKITDRGRTVPPEEVEENEDDLDLEPEAVVEDEDIEDETEEEEEPLAKPSKPKKKGRRKS